MTSFKLKVTPTRHRSTGADKDHTNRESYLIAATGVLAPAFAKAGHELPPVRVSVGFPGSRRGRRELGSCWKKEASKDGTFQIFISPVIDDTIRALDILAHELCHAATNCTGHSSEFGDLARAIGLEGKLTATYAGPDMVRRLNETVVAKLGKYPHAALSLDPAKSGRAKDGTRQIKVTCPDSGYVCRTTRLWLEKYGPPLSPVTHKPMVIAEPKEEAA